jgi:exonuclease III
MIRIASVNINGIRNATRIGMLRDFIRKHDLDIVLLQEVVAPESVDTPGYNSYTNIGPDMRGTAVLARRDHHTTHNEKVSSGKMITVVYKDIRIINVFAPMSTAKRTERERFCSVELPILVADHTQLLLLGGDFNSMLRPVDSTGHFINSKALSEIVRGLHLTDMWEQDPHTLTTPPQAPHG